MKFDKKEIDFIIYSVRSRIQAIFDDPWGASDDEKELVEELTFLRGMCEKLGLDYLQVVQKEASPYELRNMKKILPDTDLIP